MKAKILILLLLSNFAILHSQEKRGQTRTLYAEYSLYPYSSSYFDHDETTPEETKSFDIALRRTKELKYILISNSKSSKAIFYLDTIVTTPIKGKEEYWIEPEDIIYYALLEDGIYNKKESVLKQKFYTHSTEDDLKYDWKITDETTEIAGFKCIKATCEIKGNKFTAWFAPSIPISFGPMNLHGLPGLILQAESFFNTIRITSIQYHDNSDSLDSKIEAYKAQFKDNNTKESIFLIKKAALIKQMKKMM